MVVKFGGDLHYSIVLRGTELTLVIISDDRNASIMIGAKFQLQVAAACGFFVPLGTGISLTPD